MNDQRALSKQLRLSSVQKHKYDLNVYMTDVYPDFDNVQLRIQTKVCEITNAIGRY